MSFGLGALGRLGAPGKVPVVPSYTKVKLVSTRLGTDADTFTAVTSYQQLDNRILMQGLPVAVKSAQVLVCGRRVNSSAPAESDGAADFTYEGAIEQGGVSKRLTKGGAQQITVLKSDFALATDTFDLPALTPYYIRNSQRVASLGVAMPRTALGGVNYQSQMSYSNAAGNQVDATGTLSVVSTSASAWEPIGVIGIPQGDVTAIGWIGTSIDSATGDVQTPNAYGNTGYWARALDNISPNIPKIRLSRGSSDVVSTVGGNAGRVSLYQYLDIICLGAWTNDFGISNRTLAAIQPYVLTAITQAKASGRKVIAATMIPRMASSTDGYTTPGGMTYNANGYAGGAVGSAANRRNDYNTWLETLVDAGTIDALVDVNLGRYKLAGGSWIGTAGGIEDAANPGKFRTDLGAMVADGVHPNTAGAIQMSLPAEACFRHIFTGVAPAAPSLDFSQATNSMYAAVLGA